MFKLAKVIKNSFVLFLSIAVLLTATLTASLTDLTTPTAHAAVPQYLGYEGYLTTVFDDAVTDTVTMTFRIYDALAAGTLLWTEAHSNVSVTKGYFAVQLGSVTPLTLNFDIPYWISFQVNTDSEMTPRQPINSVGYAYFSDNTYAVTDADLDTTIDAGTDDEIDVTIDGAVDFQFVANILKILVGSSIEVDTISETTAAGGVTIDGMNIMNDTTTTTFLGIVGDYVRIGDAAGHDKLGTPTNDDLMVTGKLEVDGVSYFDATVYLPDNVGLTLGSSNDVGILYDENTDDTFEITGTNRGVTTEAGVHIAVKAGDAGTGTTGGTGGNVTITAGDAKGTADNAGGILRLDGGAKANSGADGYVSIGTGAPTSTLDQDSLYVAGALEVVGVSHHYSTINSHGQLVMSDDQALNIGSSGDSLLLWETADTDAHYLNLALAQASRNFIISEDTGIDWGHAASTDPTLFIHSSDGTDTTDWISFAHDQTDGVIDVGTGAVNFLDNVQVGDGTFVWGHTPQVGIEGVLEVDGRVFMDIGGIVADNQNLVFGSNSAQDGSFRHNTSQTVHTLALELGSESRSFIIMEYGDYATNFAHTLQSDPTLFIQSSDETAINEWLSFTFDSTAGTDRAEIEAGVGNIHFNSSIETGAYHFSEDAGFVAAMDMSVTATPAQGTQESYTFKIDGESFLKMYSEAKGDGTIENEEIRFYKPMAGEWFLDETSTLLSVKQTPSASTANVIATLHADGGTNWAAGSVVLKLITDDNDAIPFIVDNGSGTVASITRAGTISTNDQILLSGGGTIGTTSNGDLTLLPNGSGITIIGDVAGQDKMGTPTNDDFHVTGRMEVDKYAYFDDQVVIAAGKTIFSATDAGSVYPGNTAQTLRSMSFLTGSLANNIMIMEYGNRGINYAHTLQDNPTLYIHSTDGTPSSNEWLSFAYVSADGHAVIEAGAGNIHFNSSIETGAYEFTEDGGFLSAMDMSVSATPAAGTQESYSFKIDGQSFIKLYAEADSVAPDGGLQNESIKFYKPVVYLPSADQARLANSAIVCTDTITRVVGDGGNVTLAADPAIADGTEDGQFCIIQGTVDTTNEVTINDAVNTALSGGNPFTLAEGDTLTVIWDAGDSLWLEVSRSGN